jgi:catechol 2,3-dioxygenase-like lactoylglutathione lyase family enzyme
MTDWFARPVLHVTDVEASLLFYVNRLGFTSPWRYDEDGRAHVAQVDRQGCALILADTWPEKIGKGLMFISLNVEPETGEAAVAALDALRAELEAKGVRSRRVRGATGSWWSMIATAISSSSTIRTSPASGKIARDQA